MKTAIIGSRNLKISNIGEYLSSETTEIVSGGAKGVDKCAEEYAKERKIKLTVFLPDYSRYGKGAPLRRNLQILDYADEVIAFWDGSSRGTKYVIDQCEKMNKKIAVYVIER